MRKQLNIFIFLLLFAGRLNAQDTFSIVAADSVTGEVGSAGASCLDLTITTYPYDFLGDLIPGKGAINTQSYYLAQNQTNARSRMNAGFSPDSIISWLVANDHESDPSQRQYGIVGFVNGVPEAAAYTGSGCLDAKYHKTGRSGRFAYSIQGNILLGQFVIDSMEAQFKRAEGDLACKLMAAMQGANMVGADSRCAPNGISSLFAFLKVSVPTDAYGNPSYKIGVVVSPSNTYEPIDSLQSKFNATRPCWSLGVQKAVPFEKILVFPNPAGSFFIIRVTETQNQAPATCVVRNMMGQVLFEGSLLSNECMVPTATWQQGVYYISVRQDNMETVKRVVKF